MLPRAALLSLASTLALVFLPALRAEEKPAVQMETDVTFAQYGDRDVKLDLAWPTAGHGPFPCVVCIHGGGWRHGSRQDMTATVRGLAGRGYVAVTPSYRLAPQDPFPAQIEDCKACVRWLRANARKYHLNPDRIGVTGFSAGGHLACLLGVTRAEDALEGKGGNADQSSRVQAVVSFFGPTDLTRKTWTKEVEDGILKPFLGGTLEGKEEVYRKASPISYVGKHAPAFLFFHGTKDKLVDVEQSRLLAEKLKAAGVAARVVEMEGEGHGWRGEKLLQSINDMVAFFDEQLKK